MTNFMFKTLILTALITPISVYGQDLRLGNIVKTTELYIEAEDSVGSNNNYFLKQKEVKSNEFNMFAKFEVMDTVYYKQKINTIVGTSQFRHIGYDAEIGTMFLNSIEVYYRHFSGHSLDYRQQKRRFPQDNSIGIRFHLIN